ncbi:beta-1,6-N-acetylglucosaminyltransferase [Bacillus sp. B1-b2]|uniref:beta-1,6-N-acetylglucosaminyltransferase n=1 Tax=Bacillus sp. B1-b2 TaxID=2653201 RepID=UPI001262693D|nr:beta-1,6-N-acetylglucosaminyltransferase [Bacillus sp. B1-b2]KAB7671723.1 beta-1,6-N-acetylglucosaminyltransferase [Bacillus sp. B1-b2]
MELAFLIMAHKNVNQIARLIDKLDSDTSTFVIHFDAFGDNEEFIELREMYRHKSNIYFINRHKCYWGDISLIKVELECIELLLNENINFDYALLLSGQDYPIKSLSYIKNELQANRGKEFLQYFELPYDGWPNGGYDRLRYFHINKLNLRNRHTNALTTFLYKVNRRIKIPRSKVDYNFYGGSQWWCLSKDCLQYISKFLEEDPQYYKFFKYVNIPDEFFFQTIIMNSPFREKVINDNLKYIDWTGPELPAIFRKKDCDRLLSSSKLFARKFDQSIDEEILNLIDRTLVN